MPQLDRFLSAMAQYNADTLVLTADSPASFRINGADKPVSQQVLQAEQITSLVSEIAGPEQIESFHRDRSANFRYELQGKRYEGVLEEEAGKVVARLWSSTVSSAAVPVSEKAEAETPVVEPVSLEAQRESRATRPVSEKARGKSNESTATPASFELAHAKPVNANSIGVDSSLDAIPSNIPAKYREEMDGLLREMVKLGASDLHLSCQCGPILRVDGCIGPMEGNRPPFTPEHMTQLLFSITPQRNRDEYMHAFDTDFAYAIEGVSRFRVNLFCDRVGPGAVLRAIPNEVISAEKLGLPPVVQELARLNKGLVLATGPTGSGKSTTLASILDIVNRTREEHIITIEDPIEFVHQHKKCHVNQREVGVHTGSFKKALRAALREDPDIVLVGEMRDLETVEIAIETAETGHLVFGTLHTTTAASTVDRLIDQFPADRQAQVRTMLADSLRAVVSQTLCKKIGGGRVAALEILLGLPSVSNLIREGKTFQIENSMQTGRKQGMQTLNDHLVALVKSKQVEPMEAYLKAVDKLGLANALQRQGITLDL